MRIKNHLPNFITCLNLFSGCLAVMNIFNGNLEGAVGFIFMAAFFDFLDGFAARILRAQSVIGKELDSLADMVSFGFAPGALMFMMIYQRSGVFTLSLGGFLITVFSALRLAKFNVDPRQSDSFIGLPTPANTMLISSVVLMDAYTEFGMYLNTWVLVLTVLLSCFLLVSEIPMFSLKFKKSGFRDNLFPYLLISLTMILLVLGYYLYSVWLAFPLIIILYVGLSLIQNILNKKKA